ncbi:LOW QUALITY PROTEIN: uncharacterized protein [Panulirus ornatus]|uniref:LOW QUALITY PROTEIN: uncharacterized protein n=1 Tax=Panulirus ornatus TaxID=150431 RepID=UPI003A8BE034
MEWHMCWSIIITLWVVWWGGVVALTSKRHKGHGVTSYLHHLVRGNRGHGGYYDYSSTYDPAYYRDECMSQQLTCVPKEDCTTYTSGGIMEGRECPVNFVSHAGLCVFVANKERVYARTQTQVVEYCDRLGTRPYYFQNSEEWKDFASLIEKDYVYWLDAHWDEDRDRWEWRSTNQEIEWEKILSGSKCSEDNNNIVENEKGCLGVSLDEERGCLRLRQISCILPKLFICKAGEYKSRCVENTESVCCFSPTYDYYIDNRYGGPGSYGVHGSSKSQCWVLLGHHHHHHSRHHLVDCHAALDEIGNLWPYPQPVRIGTSFFYFSAEGPCLGERLAVISSREVHDFIVRYLMTEEMKTADMKYVIGLKYDIEEDKFHWENGKTAEYYNNETYWADGQPDKKGDVDDYNCVAYKKTNINAYSWHLLPSQICLGQYAVNVCELPIRSTNIMPTAKKVECGQRMERGVLARASFYEEENYNHAQYGEFPWHVSTLSLVCVTHSQGGVVMVFACSGALIHPQFVLTSAHCVIYSSSGDFAVSLGDWDLNEDAKHVLDTRLVTVSDVIIHPGYRSSNTLLHDVALLHLDEKIEVDEYPHVGLACLPSPYLFYQRTAAWECFTVGWPEDTHHGDGSVLQRIESNFLPRRKCRSITKSYHKALYEHKQPNYGYDKKYGYHHSAYEHHGYFDMREPELICTEPSEDNSCLDDPTPILVCRKASFYTDDPFDLGHYDYDYHHEQDHRRQAYGSSRTNKFYFSNSRIINAYGEKRFDSDKWYVLGVGHNLNSCHDKGDAYGKYGKHDKRRKRRRHHKHHSRQVYTAVHEYLSFIHSHLDIHAVDPHYGHH